LAACSQETETAQKDGASVESDASVAADPSADLNPVRTDAQGRTVTDQVIIDTEGNVTVRGLDDLVFEADGDIRQADGTLLSAGSAGRCTMIDTRDRIALRDCDDGGQRYIEARNISAEPWSVTVECVVRGAAPETLVQTVPPNGAHVVVVVQPSGDRGNGEPDSARARRAAEASTTLALGQNQPLACRLGDIEPSRSP
jgi:hypothetical protein